MSNKTNIAWCDSTWNPWSGCTKVSDGCKFCYAEARDARMMQEKVSHWGPGAPRLKHKGAVKQALALNRKPWICGQCGHAMTEEESKGYRGCPVEVFNRPNLLGKKQYNIVMHPAQHHRRRVFSLSLGDIGDKEVPMEWFNEAMVTIDKCRDVVWILCTKRPADFLERWLAVCKHWGRTDTALQPNLIMLTSVENQEQADKRIPELLKIPAACRGLSVEPMLGPVDLQYAAFNGADPIERIEGIDWVIFGGESGPNARPCDVDWIRDGAAQCKEAGVARFVKQLGAFPRMGREDTQIIRDKKGGDPLEWPTGLQIQQWPKGY